MKTFLVALAIFVLNAEGSHAQKKNNSLPKNISWLITHLLMDGNLKEVAERGYILSFTDSTLGAKLCNSFSTSISVDKKNRVKIGRTISTMIACIYQEEETAFTQALEKAKLLNASPTLLQFTDANGKVLLQAIPGNDKVNAIKPANLDYKALLSSTQWRFHTLLNADGKKDISGAGAYLQMEGANAFGKSGCNSFKGQTELMFTSDNAGRVRFGPIITTRMACPNLMETERSILKILEMTDSFLFDQNLLVLLSAEKKLAVLHPN